VRLEVRELTGLRQGDAELATRACLGEQHGGIGAVEQHAHHLAAVLRLAARQLAAAAAKRRYLRPHEGLDGIARGERTVHPGTDQPAVGRRDLGQFAAARR
jgi:hypothetical protein